MSDGEKRFKEMGERLKAGQPEEKKDEVMVTKAVGEAEINQALAIYDSIDGASAEFFRANAELGSDNLNGSMAQLKITEGTSNNEGVDGKLVAPGNFYYSPTKEAFSEVEVSISTISRSFYTKDPNNDGKTKLTQLIGGVILDGLKPFVMFASGKRLNNLWEFGKEIRPFTKSRTMPVPMLAFRVKLTLKREMNDAKQPYHVVEYTLLKNSENKIMLTNDIDTLNFLKKSVINFEDLFEGFISRNEIAKDGGPAVRRNPNGTEAIIEAEEAFLTPSEPSRVIVQDNEDIPF